MGTGTRAHQRGQRPSRFRRPLLAAGALLALGSPAISSGCVASFAPISEVRGVRVLAVTADKPYAAPGEEVTFTMGATPAEVYELHLEELMKPKPSQPPFRILWLGGCFDPPDDAYFGCYPQLAELFMNLSSPEDLLASGLIGIGPTFKLKLPDDIVSRRPVPMAGPHYGIAYVFFAVCDGLLQPIPPESSGKAGSFPLGCFDLNGNRLGAESFVPGYTQIYSFEDGRTNSNPVINGFTIDGKTIEEDADQAVKVNRCPITDEERDLPPSCTREDPYVACKSYELDIDVPEDIGEIDPESKTLDGKMLHEAVWVDYFAERGSFEGSVALVSDAVSGVTDDHKAKWLPPPDPGPVTLWAVVRDARGGSAMISRSVQVE